MNEAMEVIAKFAAEDKSAPLCGVSRCFCTASRSSGTRPLWWQQAASQQIQIRQREGGIQPHGILRQSTVANFAKAPQALDHMEDMLDARPSSGASTVNEPLILAQRPSGGTPIDPVADAGSQGGLAMRFIPVGLVAEHLALFSVQQLGHLRTVVHIRRGRAQAVHDAAPVGADVRLHPKMPVFSLLGLAHLWIARLLFILRRGRRSNDGRVHNRPGLQQQPLLLEQRANLSENPLSKLVLLEQVAKAQNRRLVGNIMTK